MGKKPYYVLDNIPPKLHKAARKALAYLDKHGERYGVFNGMYDEDRYKPTLAFIKYGLETIHSMGSAERIEEVDKLWVNLTGGN